MQGLLIVISGFSGVGKGTLVRELIKRYPDEFALSVSATTRKPREGEVHGTHYFFISKDEFEKMIDDKKLMEHAKYNGNYYGTPEDFVYENMRSGKNIILEIDIQGGFQIKAKYPETCLYYIAPKSAHDLVERLNGRGTETKEEIHNRLQRAVDETQAMDKYDHIFINDDFETCLNEMYAYIKEQQKHRDEIKNFSAQLKDELKKITTQEA